MEATTIAEISSMLAIIFSQKKEKKPDESVTNIIYQLMNHVRENFRDKGIEGILIQTEQNPTESNIKMLKTVLEVQISEDETFAEGLKSQIEAIKLDNQLNQLFIKEKCESDDGNRFEIDSDMPTPDELPLDDSSAETDDSEPDSSIVDLVVQSFQKVFEKINQFAIKNKVDEIGIDAFINQCAALAATTGAVSGFGGIATSIVGVPVDLVNCILQQFRVTLGVIYHKKGVYKVSFTELMRIVGASLKVGVGTALEKAFKVAVARQILIRLSSSTAMRAIPFVGAAIVGSVNYGYIKGIGDSVKRLDMSTYTFQSESSDDDLND